MTIKKTREELNVADETRCGMYAPWWLAYRVLIGHLKTAMVKYHRGLKFDEEAGGMPCVSTLSHFSRATRAYSLELRPVT